MKKVAIMYDFDETLCNGSEQFKSCFENLGISQENFWQESDYNSKQINMDIVLGFMYKLLSISKKENIDITQKFFNQCGKGITFFEGVENWFKQINEYANSIGLEIDHYIISCGIKDIIEGSKIANKFKRIFANCYAYDKNGIAYWPAQIVNYTTKTQYLFRIKKNLLDDLSDTKEINHKTDKSVQLAFDNMIYLGDGETDVPCMTLVKKNGGHSICVYDENKSNKELDAKRLFKDGRVDYCVKADYTCGSQLDNIVKEILQKLV